MDASDLFESKGLFDYDLEYYLNLDDKAFEGHYFFNNLKVLW